MLQIAERIRKAFESPIRLSTYLISVEVAVGCALAQEAEGDAENLLRQAQAAVKRAKRSGALEVYRAHVLREALKRFTVENRLREAIEAGTLELAFQPLINLQDGTVKGFEALSRWNDPVLGQVPPTEFIPVAEESGLIVPLGRWALCECTQTLADWDRRFGEQLPITMNVNLSPVQMVRDNVPRAVEEALRYSGIDGKRLSIELTESALISDPDKTRQLLAALQAMDVTVAMDDFGTGFSNLASLQALPIDVLKIDRSFVKDMIGDTDKIALIKAIISLAGALGMKTTAEGIEEKAMAVELAKLGCHFGQGYFFARPLTPAKAYDYWVERSRQDDDLIGQRAGPGLVREARRDPLALHLLQGLRHLRPGAQSHRNEIAARERAAAATPSPPAGDGGRRKGAAEQDAVECRKQASAIGQRLGRRRVLRPERSLDAGPGLVGEAQPRRDQVRQRRIGRQQRQQPAPRIGRGAGRPLVCDERIERLDAFAADLRQHRRQYAVLDHRRDDRGRVRQAEQLHQLVGDPLAGQRHEARGMGDAGGIVARRAVDRAEARGEAEIAQDAQMILGNARLGIADEAHAVRGKIGKAAEIVIERAVRRIGIERVHGEIAPGGIRLPVRAEGDSGAAAIGRDVAAQRRDLDRPVMDDRRHRTMGDAGRHRLEAGRPDPLHDILGPVDRCDVDILDRQAEQAVAHGPAHEARLARARAQCRAQLGEAGPRAPFGIRQAVRQRSGQEASLARNSTSNKKPFALSLSKGRISSCGCSKEKNWASTSSARTVFGESARSHSFSLAASMRRARLTRIAAVTPQMRRSAQRYS